MNIFRTETTFDGHKRLYLCGIKIGSYKANPSIELFRDMGVKIGENTRFIAPPNFGPEPFLIEIGDNCTISFGVTFLTHDGAAFICNHFTDEYLDISKFGKISIGDSCFIGCNSTIMPNIHIGNMCILGAGSVLTKSIPDGEVWAGNPAKFICKIEDYAKKTVDRHKSEEQNQLRIIVEQEKRSK